MSQLKIDWDVQRDNDLKHCSKSTRERLKENRIKVLQLSIRSPDLKKDKRVPTVIFGLGFIIMTLHKSDTDNDTKRCVVFHLTLSLNHFRIGTS